MKKFSVVFCAGGLVGVWQRTVHTASGRSSGLWQYFRHHHRPLGRGGSGREGDRDLGHKGTTFETTTNADGNYSVTHLIPDTYNFRAEGSGFKAFETKGIVVSADAGARVDGQFQVGGSTETVEVTGEAPQLKTDRADVADYF